MALVSSTTFLDGAPDGAAFGEFLRQARERRGLTLQQISSETKIPFRHLDALEHGQLHAVPGGPYRRGEIRAYAEVVGLDKAIALERLDRALQATTVAPPVPRAPTAGSPPTRSLLLVALIAGAAVGLLALGTRLSLGRSEARPQTPPLEAARTIATSTLMPLPLVLADMPATAEAAATDAATPARHDADLTITSDPPGARVTVDGIAWGVTPVTVQHLSPGDRRVRVTMSDFGAVERSVRMPDDGSAASLHVLLTPPLPK